MAVVIDALAARYGGTAYVAVQVARALAADGVTVVARRESLVAEGLRSSGARLVTLRKAGRLELPRRLAWQALALPRMVDPGTRVLTFSGMLPRRVGAPVVSHLSNPVMFERGGVANALRRRAVARTAGTGGVVVVPTRAQAQLVRDALGLEAHVVALGVDHERFSPAAAPGDEVLYVSDFYRHKRHDLVLAAWQRLPQPRPVLRLVGDQRVDPAWAAELKAAVAQLDGVVLESGLGLDELVAAYRRARVFLMASEHESFSLPLLEAQACGVPAVARDLPALRETGGPASTYVAGDDPGSWTAAVSALLRDDRLHAERRAESLAHAAHYSWERTAAALRELLLA